MDDARVERCQSRRPKAAGTLFAVLTAPDMPQLLFMCVASITIGSCVSVGDALLNSGLFSRNGLPDRYLLTPQAAEIDKMRLALR